MEDTTIEDVLKTFGDFYVKKDYENALLTLRKHGHELSPEILNYNLGTVYAQLEKWPLSRFHLLKASELGLNETKVLKNLELVESKLEIPRLEQPLNFSDYAFKSALFASEGLLTSIALLTAIIGLIVLRKKATLLKIGILSVIVCMPLGLSFWIKAWPRAIVTESQEIKEGPSAIFAAQQELPLGVLVISRLEGEWRKILYPSRFSGWIKNQGLQDLE